MLSLWGQLILMLIVILVAAHLFTNGLEHFGEKNKISEGAIGSVFAAVATALPETIVPILAIVAGSSDRSVNEQISVGSILGAPLMLSTLAIFFLAVFSLKRRGLMGRIKPEKQGFVRDLNFFLMSFSLAAIAMYVPHHLYPLRLLISAALVILYIIYLITTFKASKKVTVCGGGMADEPLLFTKIGFRANSTAILLQLLLGLVLLLLGAKGFINGVDRISDQLHISALLLSLLIIPIATELPEKVNSIIWIGKNKDTLSVGNITGAMVFQGCLLPAMGILLTPWQPSKTVLTSIMIALLASLWLRLNASTKGIPLLMLAINGLLYLAYLGLVLQ